MLEDIFQGFKLELAKKFLELEAMDYRKNVTNTENPELNENGKEWIKKVSEKLVAEFKEKFPEGADWIHFYSFGNAGSLERTITIYAKEPYWNWEKPDVHINFCTCGNPDHWGSITIGESKRMITK